VIAAALLVLVLALAGCGDDERTFEADEFVEAVNAQGAALRLGEGLASEQEGIELFQVMFAEAGEHEGEEGHAHTGGTLAVTQDTETARAEFERCDAAVTLTCYRAANAVVYFEGEPTDPEIARVDAAIRNLASE
jgi:hypothetical protein